MRGLFAAVVLLGASRFAGAEPEGLTLDEVEGCPGRAAFVQLIEQHAGQPLRAYLPAHVRIERGDNRWTAVVDLAGTPTRRFDGASCAEVLDAAALVLALSIDVSERARGPTGDSGPAHATASDSPSDPEPVRISRPAVPPRSVEMRLRAGALADVGTLPGPALAATGSGSVWRGASGFEISFAMFDPTAASVPGDSGEVAPVGLWTIGLGACHLIAPVTICAGGEAGRMTADAERLAGGEKVGGLWSAGTASAGIGRRIGGSVRVYGGVEALAAITVPRFVLDDDTSLHRPFPVSARGLIGLELDVW
ncbi:MAG TPA: hypothetical protein VIG06_31095 [Kofleriaceae bacterium]